MLTLYPGRGTARARAFHSRPGTAVKKRSLSGCALAAERAALGKRASSSACTPAAPPAPRASARYSPAQACACSGAARRRGWAPRLCAPRADAGRAAAGCTAGAASRGRPCLPSGAQDRRSKGEAGVHTLASRPGAGAPLLARRARVRVSGGRAPRSTRHGGRERLKTFSPESGASAGPAPAPPGGSSSGPCATGGSCDAGTGALVSAPAAAATALAAAAAARRARRSARAAAASSSAAARPASGHCTPEPCAERPPPASAPHSPGPALAQGPRRQPRQPPAPSSARAPAGTASTSAAWCRQLMHACSMSLQHERRSGRAAWPASGRDVRACLPSYQTRHSGCLRSSMS